MNDKNNNPIDDTDDDALPDYGLGLEAGHSALAPAEPEEDTPDLIIDEPDNEDPNVERRVFAKENVEDLYWTNLHHADENSLPDIEDLPQFDDILSDGEDHIKGTQNSTDFIARTSRMRVLKSLGLTVMAIGILGLMIFSVLLLVNEDTQAGPEPIPSSSEQPNENDGPTKTPSDDPLPSPQNPKNPLIDLVGTTYKEAPPEQSKIEAGQGVFTTTKGNTIKFTNGDTAGAKADCMVTAGYDFCYAGNVRFNGAEGEVYYLKDTIATRLFEKSQNFTEVTVKGAKVAATMDINIADKNKKNEIVTVVFDDFSGVMIILDKIEDNESFISSITVG